MGRQKHQTFHCLFNRMTKITMKEWNDITGAFNNYFQKLFMYTNPSYKAIEKCTRDVTTKVSVQ